MCVSVCKRCVCESGVSVCMRACVCVTDFRRETPGASFSFPPEDTRGESMSKCRVCKYSPNCFCMSFWRDGHFLRQKSHEHCWKIGSIWRRRKQPHFGPVGGSRPHFLLCESRPHRGPDASPELFQGSMPGACLGVCPGSPSSAWELCSVNNRELSEGIVPTAIIFFSPKYLLFLLLKSNFMRVRAFQ